MRSVFPRCASLLVLMALLSAHCFAFANQPALQTAFKSLGRQGYEALEADRFAEAEQLFRKALAQPDLDLQEKEAVYTLLAQVLVKQEKWSEAVIYYPKAIEFKIAAKPPNRSHLVTLYSQYAYAQSKLGNLDASGLNFLKAFDLVLSQWKNTQGKTQTASDASDLKKQMDYLLSSIGSVLYYYRKADKNTEALAYADEVETRLANLKDFYSPGLVEIYAHQASIVYNQQQYPSAIQIFEKAYANAHALNNYESPNWPNVLSSLAYGYYVTGDYAKSLKYYQELLQHHQQHPVLSQKQLADIRVQLQELSQMSQDNGESYIRLQGKEITRWNDKTKQLTIYIAPGESNPMWHPDNVPLLQKAFVEWQTALHDRMQFVFTDNPKKSDVTIFWPNRSEDIPSSSRRETKLGYNRTETWGEYIAKSNIYLFLDNGEGRALTSQEIYNTALHEMGHLLGILVHSSQPDDVMFKRALPDATRHAKLSARDIATVNALYDMPASISNPQGIYLSDFEKFRKKMTADMECQDAPVITLDFDLPGAYGGQKHRLVCRKKQRPSEQIPVWLPSVYF